MQCPHLHRCILSLATAYILASISVLTNPDFASGESLHNTKGHNFVIREIYCRIIWNKYLPYSLAVTSVQLYIRRTVFRAVVGGKAKHVLQEPIYNLSYEFADHIASWILGYHLSPKYSSLKVLMRNLLKAVSICSSQ